MTQREDGGPAFPVLTERTDFLSMGKELVQAAPGMTLRDWFAGHALAGLAAANWTAGSEDLARWAYELADAMLAARKAPAPESER